MIRHLFILGMFVFFVSSAAYGQGALGDIGEEPAAGVGTEDTGIDAAGDIGAAGDTAAQSDQDLDQLSFEQKDQFQQALEDRINRLQNQVDRVRSANRSNWASVRSEALNALGEQQDVLSSPRSGAESISTSPGMDTSLESVPATGGAGAAGADMTSPGVAAETPTGP